MDLRLPLESLSNRIIVQTSTLHTDGESARSCGGRMRPSAFAAAQVSTAARVFYLNEEREFSKKSITIGLNSSGFSTGTAWRES